MSPIERSHCKAKQHQISLPFGEELCAMQKYMIGSKFLHTVHIGGVERLMNRDHQNFVAGASANGFFKPSLDNFQDAHSRWYNNCTALHYLNFCSIIVSTADEHTNEAIWTWIEQRNRAQLPARAKDRRQAALR